MEGNVLKNATFEMGTEKFPKYFRHLGKMYYDKRLVQKGRSLSFAFHKPAFEKLMYELPITINHAKTIQMGIVIRANDVNQVKYVIHGYDHQHQLVKSYSHNVAPLVTREFKQISTTFTLADEIDYVRIEFQFSGILTGVTLFEPFILLN